MRERARAARENAMAMRVVGVEEVKGGKVMAMATRVASKWMVTAKTRVMVTKTKEAGVEEGNSKCGKSDGDGEEDSEGEQRR